MEGQQFDRIIRALGQGATRRGVLAVLGGLLTTGVGEAAAKRRHPRRKNRNQARPGQKGKGKGKGTLPVAGSGAGKSAICHRDAPTATTYTKLTVALAAVPVHLAHGDFLWGECCNDGDCGTTGQVCNHGDPANNIASTCVCPDNKPHFCSSDQTCHECCDNADCDGGSPVCNNGTCVCGDVCAVENGCQYTSVKQAIADASAGGEILVCAGTYRESQILIGKKLTVTGAGTGAGGTTLNGGQDEFVIAILAAGDVTLNNLTVTGGTGATTAGGGIRNFGKLTLQGVSVTNNSTTRTGGGIQNWANSTLELNDSRVTNNHADEGGGGIQNVGVTTLINNSSVTDNTPNNCAGSGTFNDPDGACAAP